MTELSPADWLLALIPAPLVIGAAVGVVSSLSLATAIGAGSVPATGLVGYALFGLPPQ
ncbi:hypothetical protein [Halapricum desulfuricans]|uniref:Sulfite exporter TauE/SafE family protein n=1 Tax=Halapricum desulfuricans TaxID=2841257 RepID=A0A897N577_9EURY|nr:hypothetical protein [Halapricum desulfuricans]QSG08012.1 Uncharacterized protein HSR122_0605 [Halapricum desulfuricans]